MEQFVLGIFQEQLSKFIIGFRKEQVNANLLNGKGEIRNVEINCSFLNSHLSKLTPYVELERVHVSKLSFTVTSWTNLRKAPIIIDVEDVQAYLLEPLHYLDPSLRKSIQQIFESQLPELLRRGLVSKRGAYNLFDRILDNLTIEVRSILIEFTTWGRFKTRRAGPWSPPKLQVQLAGLRMVSVNEFGVEASPDEVWRHNHNRHSFLIYKKIEIPDYQVSFIPRYGSDKNVSIPILSGHHNKIEVQLAIVRRVRDGETLAVQLDAVIPKVEIDITPQVLPHWYSVTQAVIFLLAKDRAFEDPLRSETEGANTDETEGAGQVQVSIVRTASSASDGESSTIPTPGSAIPLEDDLSSSSGEEDATIDSRSMSDSRHSNWTEKTASTRSQTPILPMTAPARDKRDRPVIVLPLGLCIHEKISFSLSIHHACIRGTYAHEGSEKASSDGYVQIVSNGFIAEMIWPKVDLSKGGYIQASVGFVRVTERFKNRVRTLLVGGAEHDRMGMTRTPKREVLRDESFPLYEDRCIRPDPCGLRYTFPKQCFGVKTTIEFFNEAFHDLGSTMKEDIKVIHDVGIDDFDFVVDCQSWARVLRFALNKSNEGFDQRVSSGDWINDLSQEMLICPGIPFGMEACIQPKKELLLDENDFPSSELFNMTARLSDTVFRIPAAIADDARACDIVTRFGEMTWVVSSALPRSFLSGRIGSCGKDESELDADTIDFPNDPSDIAFNQDVQEHPGSISTLRVQLTMRETNVRLAPILMYSNETDSQQIFHQDELTVLLSFEGEPPRESNKETTRIALFASMESHRVDIRLDFDLLTSAIGTIAHHVRFLTDAFIGMQSVSNDGSVFSETIPKRGTTQNALSRKVLVQRQIWTSRDSGGLSLALCINMMELDVSVWRQNIRLSSIVPHNRDGGGDRQCEDNALRYTALAKLALIEMRSIEIGLETVMLGTERRIVAKAAIGGFNLNALPLDKTLPSTQGGEHIHEAANTHMIQIGKGKGQYNQNRGLVFRAEEQSERQRTWSLALDLGSVEVTCEVEMIEMLITSLLEGLSMPAWMNPKLFPALKHRDVWSFPSGSVGSFLQNLVQLMSENDDGFSMTSHDTSNEANHTVPASIDTMLREIIWKVVPVDVEMILLRFGGENHFLRIPSRLVEEPSFALILERTEFYASYVATSGLINTKMMHVLGSKGKSWQSLMQNIEPGLRHKMSVRPRIIGLVTEEYTNERETTLVEPFEVSYSYTKSGVVVTVGSEIVVDQVERLDEFFLCLNRFSRRFKEVEHRVRSLFSTFRRRTDQADENVYNLFSTALPKQDQPNPTTLACSTVVDSIRSARQSIRATNEAYMASLQKLQSRLHDAQIELARMRLSVFQKERERISAFALTSASAIGWLRVGSSSLIGQRGTMSWTLDPYWCVLRKSLLLLHTGPGELTPTDAIPLKGCTLKQLAGGRKRDLKRAFALVESEGAVHIIVTASDHEFYLWVRKIANVIGVPDSEKMAMEHLGSLAISDNSVRESCSAGVRPEQGTGTLPRSNRIANALQQAAKSTGEAVAERRRKKRIVDEGSLVAPTTKERVLTERTVDSDEKTARTGQETLLFQDYHTSDTSGRETVQNKGTHLRHRFADIRSATKFRVESALVAAKQKGKNVSVSVRHGIASKNVAQIPSDDTEDNEPAENSLRPKEFSWSCEMCTYYNSRLLNSCEMCQSTRHTPSGEPNYRPAGGGEIDTQDKQGQSNTLMTSDGLTVANAKDNVSSQQRLSMKEKFGAAVRSIRGNGPDDKLIDDSSLWEPAEAQRSEECTHVPSVIKLRDVGLAGPLPPQRYANPLQKHSKETGVSTLKRLDGIWLVRIDIPEWNVPDTARTQELSIPNLLNKTTKDEEELSSTDGMSVVDNHLSIKVDIHVFDKGCLESSGPRSVVNTTFHEVLAIYSAVSDNISAAYLQCRERSKCFGDMSFEDDLALMNSLEAISLAGKLLSGALNFRPTKLSKPIRSYAGEAVSNFFNALLDSYLPQECLLIVADFLKIHDAATNGYHLSLESTQHFECHMSNGTIESPAIPLMSVTEACLVEAETQALIAEHMAILSDASPLPGEEGFPCVSLFDLYDPTSHHFRDTMYSVLMNIMEERDEAHARMVAADVVHVHEIEQERKNVKHLTTCLEKKQQEIEYLKQSLRKGTPGAFPHERVSSPVRAQSDTEAELVSLCQQLSAEIFLRTSASLEVVRLKECRQIERENEAAERQVLERELSRTRELLAGHMQKLAASERDCLNWKRSYEKVIQHRERQVQNGCIDMDRDIEIHVETKST